MKETYWTTISVGLPFQLFPPPTKRLLTYSEALTLSGCRDRPREGPIRNRQHHIFICSGGAARRKSYVKSWRWSPAADGRGISATIWLSGYGMSSVIALDMGLDSELANTDTGGMPPPPFMPGGGPGGPGPNGFVPRKPCPQENLYPAPNFAYCC